jgi:hypothetical protein
MDQVQERTQQVHYNMEQAQDNGEQGTGIGESYMRARKSKDRGEEGTDTGKLVTGIQIKD